MKKYTKPTVLYVKLVAEDVLTMSIGAGEGAPTGMDFSEILNTWDKQ